MKPLAISKKKHIAMVPMVFTFIGFFEGMIDMRMKSCFSSIELVVSRNPAPLKKRYPTTLQTRQFFRSHRILVLSNGGLPYNFMALGATSRQLG